MTALSLVSDKDLLDHMPRVVLAERGSTADVIQHLMEIDRRRLYLDAACRSLSSYCMERLGYSEDEANKRVRVTQVARRIPQVLVELRSGAIHLTGLWLLGPALTEDNAENLLVSARGKTRRQIEELIVRHFPMPDLPERVCPDPQQLTMPAESRCDAELKPAKPAKVEPLSGSRWSVQLSIGAELKAKIEEAKQLLSHAVPQGDLATLIERAFDALLVQEKKHRFGAGKPRKRRLPKPGSRHIPVELVREVTERDGGQCTFVDENGARCSAREWLTPLRVSRSASIEHRHPFALGGPTTAANLCLLCAAHNRHTARRAFGEEHVERRILEAEYERTHVALRKLGFRDSEARKALATLRQTSRATRMKDLLVEVLAVLVPAATTLTVRDSSRPRWPVRAQFLSWAGIGHTFTPAVGHADPSTSFSDGVSHERDVFGFVCPSPPSSSRAHPAPCGMRAPRASNEPMQQREVGSSRRRTSARSWPLQDAVLVPATTTLTVRDSSLARWPLRARCPSWAGIGHTFARAVGHPDANAPGLQDAGVRQWCAVACGPCRGSRRWPSSGGVTWSSGARCRR